jgi:hypothetical protein
MVLPASAGRTVTSRGKSYQLYGRSITLAEARRQVKAIREHYPEAFARTGENCGEIFVLASRPS